MDRLLRIIAFNTIGPGATSTVTDVQGLLYTAADPAGTIPIAADQLFLDNGSFSVTNITTTSITVRNNGAGVGSCNVLLWHWHTFIRNFGATGGTPDTLFKALTPQPFIVAGGSGSGGGVAGYQAFTYTATGIEGTDFIVTLPVAELNDNYVVIPGQAGQQIAQYTVECPDLVAGDRTPTQFRVLTSLAPSAGDKIDFMLATRT